MIPGSTNISVPFIDPSQAATVRQSYSPDTVPKILGSQLRTRMLGKHDHPTRHIVAYADSELRRQRAIHRIVVVAAFLKSGSPSCML
jgi:hypothetical protein